MNSLTIVPRNDIIPIMYVGGSGGHFLASFLFHANHNNFNEWKFSPNGNVHGAAQHYTSCSNGNCHPDIMQHITGLNSLPITSEIKYPTTHCPDIDLTLTYFDRVIKTYLDEDDIKTVCTIFCVKHELDDNHCSVEDVVKHIPTCIFNTTYRKHNVALRTPHNSPQLLNISFKEMISGDTSILINKLSEFTLIPASQFNVAMFLRWRHLTTNSILPYL